MSGCGLDWFGRGRRRSGEGRKARRKRLTHEDDVVAVIGGFGGLDGQLAVLGRVDELVLSLAHICFQETEVDFVVVDEEESWGAFFSRLGRRFGRRAVVEGHV